jgi:hypothetical protein
MLPLAAVEQPLQAPEQAVLLLAATTHRTAARLAAADPGVASGLAATVASAAGRLAATIPTEASTGPATAGLAGVGTARAGVACGLSARGAALMAEHPVQDLESI